MEVDIHRCRPVFLSLSVAEEGALLIDKDYSDPLHRGTWASRGRRDADGEMTYDTKGNI